MDKVLPIVRKEYPLKIRVKELKTEEDRYETLRLQLEGSEHETVEDSLNKE